MDRYRWIRRIAEKTGIAEKVLTEEMDLLLSKTKTHLKAQYKPQEEHQTFNDGNGPSLKSRSEQLALEVLSLYTMGDGAQKEMKEHELYFPQRFASVFKMLMGEDAVLDTKTGDTRQSNATGGDTASRDLAAYIEMRGSLREFPDEETRLAEMVFLLGELKKEYLKQKQSSIMKKIKEHEKTGKEVDEALLEEFNRVTKLLNS